MATFADQEQQAQNIPGMAVALLREGEQAEYGCGRLEPGGQPVTADTVFGTASVTKSFTALAIMILQAEGKLSAGDRIVSHLPELKDVPGIGLAQIRHLLSHTAGVPPLARKEELDRFEDHFDYLNRTEIEPLGRPGEKLSYSNDSFLLLGAIIGRASGMDYREFIRERILLPAGMKRTSFDPPAQGASGNVAVQFVEENERMKAVDWPALGNYAVGGGIRSTVRDLMNYLKLYIDGEYREKVLGVRVEAEEMWKDPHPVNRHSGYGFGLSVSPDFHGRLIVHHGGSQPGVSSAIGFLPEEKIAAAVLTNRSDCSADTVLHGLLNIGLGLDPADEAFTEPEHEMDGKELSAFEGIYRNDENPEGFEIRIGGTGPEMIVGNVSDRLRASGPKTLVNIRTNKTIEFEFGEDGKTTAFSGMRIYWKDAGKQ
ncbi:serine hydrolase domain-containing protein [Bhargavaea ullalensis]|uniref:CubicO group peptidase (Beta-lactamase class C family) n=1 Tax=Bhargavaea ullalensis TaxID=1265685 RepID=A0ABV2G9G6_9BACL